MDNESLKTLIGITYGIILMGGYLSLMTYMTLKDWKFKKEPSSREKESQLEKITK